MKKLIKEVPFIRFLVVLMLGIFFADMAKFDNFLLNAIVVGFSLTIFLIYLFVPNFYKNYKIRWIPGFAILVFLFSFGWILTRNSFPSEIKSTYEVVATGKIKRVENKQDTWVRIIFCPEKINNDSLPFKNGDEWTLIVRNEFIEIFPEAGQIIAIKGKLDGHSKPSNPDAFDYGAYLFRKGISGQMFVPPQDIIFFNEKARKNLFDIAENIRSFLMEIFKNSNINDAGSGIVSALILGDRSGIDRDLNERFVRSGAVHMLAVSGLHVGIIYLLINFILNIFFKPSSKIRMALAITLMFAYAFITGFSPSVNRAVFMFSLMQIGKSMAKNVNTYNTLSASAFILLIINPMFLFNIGFWFSHLAVAGIVAFTAPFESIFNENFLNREFFHKKYLKYPVWLLKKTWSLISVSMAAQLGLLPVLLHLFGAFPIYFLVTNIIVLPLVAPVIILGIVYLAVSWIPILSDITAWILNLVLRFMEISVTYIDTLPNAYIEGIWVSIPLVLMLYILIISFYNLFEYVSGKKIVAIALFTALSLLILNVQYISKTNDKFVVFNVGNNVLIESIEGGKSTVFASPKLTEKNLNFAATGFNTKNTIKMINFNILDSVGNSLYPLIYTTTLKNTNIAMLSGGARDVYVNKFNKPVDILVIFGKTALDATSTVENLNCHTIVFASNCPPWLVSRWTKELEHKTIKIHNVRNDGAFVMRLKKK